MKTLFRLILLKIRLLKNRLGGRNQQGTIIACVIFAAVFIGIFWLSHWLLLKVGKVPAFGYLLQVKLLQVSSMVLFIMLIMSNLVTALGTLFLADDLPFLFSRPISHLKVFASRLLETVFASSWMVLSFFLPSLAAFGAVNNAPFVFYLGIFLVLIPFLFIPTSLACIIAVTIANFLSVKKARKAVNLLAVLSAGALVFTLRAMRPESFLYADRFDQIMTFLKLFQAPTTPYLPSAWLSDLLTTYAEGTMYNTLIPSCYLLGTALVCVSLTVIVARFGYFRGWSRSQESSDETLRSWTLVGRLSALAGTRAARVCALAEKETKIFLRNPALLTQFLMLGAITILYLYNLHVLPLDEVSVIYKQLPDLITYLNIGFVAFIVAALAVRFVYPAVSLEGKAFWIIQNSPVTMTELVLSKYIVYLIPLLFMATSLSLLASFILESGRFFAILSLVDICFLTMMITAINAGFGGVYPHFEAKNAIQIPLSFGGLLAMVLSMIGIIAMLALQAFPVYRFLRYGINLYSIGTSISIKNLLLFLLSFVMCLLATWGSLRWSIVRLKSYGQY